MGMMDRDYWRERYNSMHYNPREFRGSRGAPAVARRPGHARPRWGSRLLWIGVIGLVMWAGLQMMSNYLFIARPQPGVQSLAATGSKPAVNAFQSGAALWYVPRGTELAPFGIRAPTEGPAHYAIKLVEWQSGRPVVLITLSRGGEISVPVPLGEYRAVIAAGNTWYGPEKLFGFFGEQKESVDPLHFYRTAAGYHGRTLDLKGRLDGNMRTRSTNAFFR